MTDTQRVLNNALPFDINENDPDASYMLQLAPSIIWEEISLAKTHEETVKGFDKLEDWVVASYHQFFPIGN